MRIRFRGALGAAAIGLLVPAAIAWAEGDAGADPTIWKLATACHEAATRIRLEAGAPARGEVLPLRGVGAAELHALAEAFATRVDRLAFELAPGATGDGAGDASGERPGTEPILVRSLAALDAIGSAIGAPTTAAAALSGPARSEPSHDDAARVLLEASRAVDAVLERKVGARHAFREITVATGLAARLLERVPGARRLPDPPPSVRGAGEADVFARLVRCLAVIEALAPGGARVDPLAAESFAVIAEAGDSFDLAAVVRARVAALYARAPDVGPPLPGYDPGAVLRSATHQRAGVLEIQLAALRDAAIGGTAGG